MSVRLKIDISDGAVILIGGHENQAAVAGFRVRPLGGPGLVAADEDDRPVAYIDLEPNGHINRLFCAPEAAGQGIASRLYDAVEAAAREQGIRSLFTEASELARRLFERKGFAVVERQDMVIRGVAIHNYRMAKALDLAAPLPARSGSRPRTAPWRACGSSRFPASSRCHWPV